MEINRNNYEEYFLLYADNELSKTEKKVVEIFVQENIDLKEEFLMITLTVNSPDEEVQLIDKSFLMKNEPSFINQNNCEEIFVLYFDEELSASQKKEVENFVKENPEYKTEFELTGKAKLISDNTIVYTNKKQLYKKEKSGKIIRLLFWRSVAAAVFIGFGLWISVSYYNKEHKNIPVASHFHTKAATSIDKNIIDKGSMKEKNDLAASAEKTQPAKIQTEEREITKPALKEKNEDNFATVKLHLKAKKLTLKQKIKEIKPVIDNEEIAAIEPILIPGRNLKNQPISENSGSQTAQTNNTDKAGMDKNKTRTLSYISDASVDNQDYVFYDVSAEEFRKSKVGEFLKKVKRIVERSNPIARIFTGDEEQTAIK
jgi:hypothetical protein